MVTIPMLHILLEAQRLYTTHTHVHTMNTCKNLDWSQEILLTELCPNQYATVILSRECSNNYIQISQYPPHKRIRCPRHNQEEKRSPNDRWKT